MIDIKEVLNRELFLIEDRNYTYDRFQVILGFLDKMDYEVLDYHIILKQNKFSIEESYELVPTDLIQDFEDTLKDLNDALIGLSDEEDIEDLSFELKILVRKRPFDLNKVFDLKEEFKEDIMEDD